MKGKRTKDERKYNNLNIKHDTKVCLDTSTTPPPPHKRRIKDGTLRYKTELRCTPTDGGRTRGIDLICLAPREDTGAPGTGDGLLREAGGDRARVTHLRSTRDIPSKRARQLRRSRRRVRRNITKHYFFHSGRGGEGVHTVMARLCHSQGNGLPERRQELR
ncbi:hypothetical protein E2C01_042509 [Portunus trituberculatus]|uniref:Uncharacterized protein n=1 Tax=Portunus trituberculatus TaxID=210409 RepID=A0A5B7FTN1_PORTR|nr:hypothetical protein [Portunus trituberculatus]